MNVLEARTVIEYRVMFAQVLHHGDFTRIVEQIQRLYVRQYVLTRLEHLFAEIVERLNTEGKVHQLR